jgi:hypothetical protein
MATRQSDYLLRMIEQLRQFLAQITRLRRERCHDEALTAVMHAQERLFGLSAERFIGLTPSGQFDLITKGESPEHAREKCLMLVDLLAEAARIYTDKEQPALALGAWRFCLEILEQAAPRLPDNDSKDIHYRLEKVRGALGETT